MSMNIMKRKRKLRKDEDVKNPMFFKITRKKKK